MRLVASLLFERSGPGYVFRWTYACDLTAIATMPPIGTWRYRQPSASGFSGTYSATSFFSTSSGTTTYEQSGNPTANLNACAAGSSPTEALLDCRSDSDPDPGFLRSGALVRVARCSSGNANNNTLMLPVLETGEPPTSPVGPTIRITAFSLFNTDICPPGPYTLNPFTNPNGEVTFGFAYDLGGSQPPITTVDGTEPSGYTDISDWAASCIISVS